jgi:hypothetical protein
MPKPTTIEEVPAEILKRAQLPLAEGGFGFDQISVASLFDRIISKRRNPEAALGLFEMYKLVFEFGIRESVKGGQGLSPENAFAFAEHKASNWNSSALRSYIESYETAIRFANKPLEQQGFDLPIDPYILTNHRPQVPPVDPGYA